MFFKNRLWLFLILAILIGLFYYQAVHNKRTAAVNTVDMQPDYLLQNVKLYKTSQKDGKITSIMEAKELVGLFACYNFNKMPTLAYQNANVYLQVNYEQFECKSDDVKRNYLYFLDPILKIINFKGKAWKITSDFGIATEKASLMRLMKNVDIQNLDDINFYLKTDYVDIYISNSFFKTKAKVYIKKDNADFYSQGLSLNMEKGDIQLVDSPVLRLNMNNQ